MIVKPHFNPFKHNLYQVFSIKIESKESKIFYSHGRKINKTEQVMFLTSPKTPLKLKKKKNEAKFLQVKVASCNNHAIFL